jgi:hypothetical protein
VLAFQQATTFTARPPWLVSLYFDDMSIPVWRIVSITWSSETRGVSWLCSASRAALTALTAPMALRSMQGICTSPPHRIAG